MSDPKMENLLNLALEATLREREQSLNLNVGFDEQEDTWELVVKYHGDLNALREQGIRVVELQNEYAILTVPEALVGKVSQWNQIEYVEKPKRLYFALEQGRSASCVTMVQTGSLRLFGRGTLVACLDSGVDYAHPDFRNEDGSSRILFLWDQTLSGNPPKGYAIGTEFTKEQLDAALERESKEGQQALVPSVDTSGHGTGVLGIAAGNGRASGGRYRGVASESSLLVVKLGMPRSNSFPRTTELMQAVDYCVKKAIELEMPLAVNISFGNTYGAHDGTSLLETYLTDMANVWKSVFCIGTGNEGYGDGHTSGRLASYGEQRVEFAVGAYETVLNIQLWKSYIDVVEVYLIHPNGRVAGPLRESSGAQRIVLGETELLVYYGEPTPYSQNQEIYFDFLPREDYIDSGIWSIGLVTGKIVNGVYHMWMPSQAALNRGTRFLYPTPQTTLTIPSTARKTIAVGAYDSRNLSYADFSGRGEPFGEGIQRPDLVAPGVNIMTTAVGGGYAAMTGTSFATPFVTGAAALLAEWGIVKGNDPFLYGEKVKAYLQRGARELPGFLEYPNPQVGYGALCVRDSIPV
ncbi:MAG: S8 family peptidase [Lachnospiraceae bacterium]|nr:S8 family peptidase [Lachnospiraceae bacterium]